MSESVSTLDPALLRDMNALEQTLTADASGQRSRALLAHLEQLSQHGEQQISQAVHEGERQVASQIAAGYRACQRVIRQVWEQQHGKPLAA